MIRLLVGMCGVQTETLAVVREFFLLERQKFLKFLHSISIQNFYFFLIFQNFWSYISMVKFQITTDCPVRQILFLMHCFACFDETIDFISGISHGEVIIQKG